MKTKRKIGRNRRAVKNAHKPAKKLDTSKRVTFMKTKLSQKLNGDYGLFLSFLAEEMRKPIEACSEQKIIKRFAREIRRRAKMGRRK